MKYYDRKISKEIDELRIKAYTGEKPNANSHIYFKGGFYDEPVYFYFKEKEKT